MEIYDIREHGGEAYWANDLEQVIQVLCGTPEHAAEILPPQEDWLL
jgi:hypothetical protein